MHVLILNQVFHPDVAATGQLMYDLARYLVGSGHRVTVITGRSYYGTTRRHDLPREHIDGIDVIRIGWSALGKRSVFTRLVDFASFYVGAALELARSERPDVILALTSPPLVATLAALQERLRNVPFVHHVMDVYPDAMIASGMLSESSSIALVLHAITGRTLSSAAGVIALGRDMRARLLQRYPRTDPHRIHVVPPWADGEDLKPLARKENPLAVQLGLHESFNVVYSGNLGIAHDVDTLVAAVVATRDDLCLQWIFIGGGKRLDLLQQQATQQGWHHVRFLPFQGRDKLNLSLNLADVHLVSQLPEFGGIVVPSKLFGILAVGRPAVMVGPVDVEASRILLETGCGEVVANGDAAALVSCLHRLQSDPDRRHTMGRRARDAFLMKYERKIACSAIERILIDATRSKRVG